MGNSSPIPPYFENDKIITLNGTIQWNQIKHISRDRDSFGCWYNIIYDRNGEKVRICIATSCDYPENNLIIKNNEVWGK